MSKRFLLWLSLAFFTCSSIQNLNAAYAPVEAYEDRPVGDIEITIENLPPNATFDQKSVLSRLKTKVGDPFSQMIFDSDLKTLAEEYDRVEPNIRVHNGEVYISLKVWPRPTIRTIKWEGNTHMSTKTLQKELGIKPQDIFNQQAFNKAFNKVKEYYVKKGYFESQLQYSLVRDPKTNEVDILIRVKEGRSGKIDNIVFKGFTKKEKSEILEMIYTKKYNFFTSWITGEGMYKEEALDQDKLVIVNMLQNEGYADAKVDIQIKEAKTEGKIIIEITAERGSLFHFGVISFSGNTLFSDKQIESRFLARPKEEYSPEKLRDTATAIKDMYGRRGYIEANVQFETQLVENEPIYNAHFQIEEGEQYKIGLIKVFGNSQTQTSVILRESLLIPGETFDALKLKMTQAKLENVGYFKSVNVYAVRTQDDQSLGENYRDVFIEVEETHTGNASLFGGFSSADSIFGGLDLAETNFNYKGIAKLFTEGPSALRGGGEYAHARASFGKKIQSYTVSWLTPYFRDTLWRVGADALYQNSQLQSEDYNVITMGGSLYASYPITPYWAFGTKYRIREVTADVSRHTPPAERALEDQHGIISAISMNLVYDTTDSPIKPHNGYRSMFELEYTGIGGNFFFARVGYLNTYYAALWSHGIMKYRFDARFIYPLFDTNTPFKIPVAERFFLGGINSVRGYKDFDLGPHFSNGDPTGGISSTLLSIEYLQEVFKFLDLFVFADGGSVSLHRFQIGKFNLSYGFGARLDLMNRVPIILGMGFPINPDFRGQVRRFFFSMGGQF